VKNQFQNDGRGEKIKIGERNTRNKINTYGEAEKINKTV
jgi:hypothetical protein